jgi:hypothetical protein
MGFCHQFMIMNILFILNTKYQENLVKFTGYVFSGTAVSLFWGFVFTLIVNPGNEPKSVEFRLPSGDVEFSFSKEVSLRFPLLCWAYGFVNIVVPCTISFCIHISEDSLAKISTLSSRGNDERQSFVNINTLSVISARNLGGFSTEIGQLIGRFCL